MAQPFAADRTLQCARPASTMEAGMNMRISQLTGMNSTGYYDRLPEKLVLEGYRRWTAGFETGSIIPWEMAWGLYAEILGPREVKRAIAELRSGS